MFGCFEEENYTFLWYFDFFAKREWGETRIKAYNLEQANMNNIS